MVRGSPGTISCGFKVELCVEKYFHGVFAWSYYSADKCNVWITDEMDMTPLQVSCWRGKFLRQAQSGTPSTINLYMMKLSAWQTWMSCSYAVELHDKSRNDPVHMWDRDLVITVPAEGPAPNGAEPSAGTVMTNSNTYPSSLPMTVNDILLIWP